MEIYMERKNCRCCFFGFGLENDRGRSKNDTPLSYQDLIPLTMSITGLPSKESKR
jgi:hypothetical protein